MSASVQCVAMRTIDDAEVAQRPEVVQRADPGQEQHRDLRSRRGSTAAADELPLVVCEKP